MPPHTQATSHSMIYRKSVNFSSLMQPPWRDAKLETIFLINKIQFGSILRDVTGFIPTISFCLKCGCIEDFKTKFWEVTSPATKTLIFERSQFQEMRVKKFNSDEKEKEIEESAEIFSTNITELRSDLPRLHSYLLFLLQKWMIWDVDSFEAILAKLPRSAKTCKKCKVYEILLDRFN